MAKKNVINDPIDASGLNVTIDGIFMQEKRYLLSPLEHKILSETDSLYKEWSKRFLLISLGLMLTVLSKLVIFLFKFSNEPAEERQNLNMNIESWEIIYLIIGLLASLLLFILSQTKLDKSERKNVMKNIKDYFDAA